MLPVSSATTCSSCYAKVPIHGGLKSLWPPHSNSFDFSSNSARSASCFYSNYVDGEKYVSMGTRNQSMYPNGLGSVKQLINSSYRVGVDQSNHLGRNGIVFVDSSSTSVGDDQVGEFISNATLLNFADSESVSTFKIVQVVAPTVPDSLNIGTSPSSGQEVTVADLVSKMNQSVSDTIKGGENFLNNLVNTVTSSVTATFTDAKEVVDNVVNDVISFVNQSGESANNKLSGLTTGAKDASGKAGLAAVDVLRGTVVVVEKSLIQGAQSIGYAYSSAKDLLPPDFRQALNLSEESFVRVLSPAGAAFQQVYMVVEGFEKKLGLDPNDPLVPLALFIGVSTTLWGSYRVFRYSGYAGDLSPKSTLELLRGKENVALVDIRSENLREKDGIPDLRRGARFRYASVTFPEVDGSVKKLLKGGRDLEDSLLAAVIRNLKIVENSSKVVVMDADGSRSKSVARTLRKFGIKRPYLVQGGFRYWVKEGIRVKPLKAETALTILNEDAEAILEEINPTPLKVFGFGLAFAAATYSLIEWETTLQFIGIIGIGQTLFRRLASYQDADDFKEDVRLLLSPVKLGGEAFSWVAGKLETNINGLPMSPSSSDVQSRVLQAAAKHESQPSDSEEPQDSSQVVSSSENVKISEA